MNTLLKKVIVFPILFCLIALCTFNCLCVGENETDLIVKTENEKNSDFNYLMSCGYPAEFLQEITDSTKKNIVSLIKDSDITNVDYTTEYWPDNNRNKAKVALNIVFAEMTDPKTKNIIGASVCVYWKWVSKAPIVREEDYLSARWNKDVFCYDADSFSAEDYCKNKNDDVWLVTNTQKKLAHADVQSLGHWTDLKKFKHDLGGAMVFNLKTVSSIDKDPDYNKFFSVTYSHEFDTLKTVLWFTLPPIIILALVLTVIFKKRKKRDN